MPAPTTMTSCSAFTIARVSRQPASALARPDSMSGCPNVKPAASSLVGATRWPAEQHLLAHLPERGLHGRGGQREDRRPVQGTAERLDELLVRDGARRDHVDGACERLLEREEIGGDGVVERDPAPPLATAADPSARAELERQQHPRERSAVLREHDPLAQVHGAEPCGTGGLGRSLPRLDDVGEEPRAGHRVLVDDLVAAVAVEPGRGRADEHRAAARGRRQSRRSAASRSTRESSTARRTSSLQRWPMFSPARWTIASTPSSAAASIVPASMSH